MNPRILIKIGGQAFEDENGFKELASAIKAIRNIEIVIVHGGGAEISQALKDAGRDTRFIDGIRVTLAEDIKIVENVLSGSINRRITGWLEENGVACLRMSGKTDNLFVVRPMIRKGQALGYVGEIEQVHPNVIIEALNKKLVPVVSPISADQKGVSYNVNADSAAAALAASAECTDLVFVTDVPGVMVDNQVRPRLDIKKAQILIAADTISGGMVAKMESAFEALHRRVPRVHIICWQGSQTLNAVIQQKSITGTIITA